MPEKDRPGCRLIVEGDLARGRQSDAVTRKAALGGNLPLRGERSMAGLVYDRRRSTMSALRRFRPAASRKYRAFAMSWKAGPVDPSSHPCHARRCLSARNQTL